MAAVSVKRSIVPCSGYFTASDQSMVESGVTEGGKNTASFHFWGWTQQGSHHKHEATVTTLGITQLDFSFVLKLS